MDVLLTAIQQEIPSYAAYPNLAWQEVSTSDITGFHNSNYFSSGAQLLSPQSVSGLEGDMRERYPEFAALSRKQVQDAKAAAAESEMPEIPKVIHQTWKSREITAPFRTAWADSWRELNPDWEYRLWTDADLEEFVRTEFPNFLPIYLGYDATIKRVDSVRYLIMKRLGGVFVDLDFICLRPLETLLEGMLLVFGQQCANHLFPGAICNAFMASAPGHPFWDGIENALEASRHFSVVDAAGPDFLTQRFKSSRMFLEQDMMPAILPPFYLYPVEWNDPQKDALRDKSRQEIAAQFPASFAATVWTGSWLGT